jgi:hypothetical protein
MTDAETLRDEILERLRAGMVEELADLVVDHVLDRPVTELVDPDWLAGQVVHSLQAATAGPRTEEWLREQVQGLRERVPDGRVGDHAPDEIVDPLRTVLARPVVFDRALVGRLLDHEAARGLVKDLLRGSLDGFTKRLRTLSTAVPAPPPAASRGFGRLKALSAGVKTVSEGVLGGIGKELEERSGQRISEFLDASLSAAMGQVADHLTNPRHAAAYGAYRVHVLDTLLQTENSLLNSELEKLDPDSLVATGAATARAVARRDGLREELAGAFRVAVAEAGDQTVRGFLAETGIEEAAGTGTDAEWRRELQVQIARQATAFVDTPAFSSWLLRLLQPA